MVGLEAALLGKPILSANFSNYPQWEYLRLKEYGASINIENYDNLEKFLGEILKKNMHLEKLRSGRKKITEMYNYRNDGKASIRIVEEMTKEANPLD